MEGLPFDEWPDGALIAFLRETEGWPSPPADRGRAGRPPRGGRGRRAVSALRRRLTRLESAAALVARGRASGGGAPEPPLFAALVAYFHHGPHAPLPPDLRGGVDLFLAEHASRSGAR